MAGSVNKVTLLGNLGQDPELRNTKDGRPVATLSIATGDSWRDKASGERRERTEWHRVVIFSEGLCRLAEQYLKKGSKIYLEGELRTRKWQDQSGADKYTTEVVLNNFNSRLVMLDSRQTSESDKLATAAPPAQMANDDAETANTAPLDDEVPF